MKISTKQRRWITACINGLATQKEVMARLDIKRDYHKFYSLYYQVHQTTKDIPK